VRVRFALPGDEPDSWDLILVDDDRRHEERAAIYDVSANAGWVTGGTARWACDLPVLYAIRDSNPETAEIRWGSLADLARVADSGPDQRKHCLERARAQGRFRAVSR